MKKKTWTGIIIIALIVALQFWPVDRTNPPVSSEIQAPPDVRKVLRTSCYNCHSNETDWPWYGYVAPVSWLLASDVHEARQELNFSEWGSMPEAERSVAADHIWKMVEKGEMPLLMYRIMHPEANLSEDQKKLLHDWVLSNPN
jgi:hypothetical protein